MPAANPSAAQLQALRAYAQAHGRTWRAQLHAEWMNACQGISDPDQRALLQQLRNEFGPRWLKLRGREAAKPLAEEALDVFSAPPVPDAELAAAIAKKRGEIEASGLAQWAYQAPACPSCGGALELVKAEEGGEVEEPYFPKYPMRDEPLPRRRRPATFWACSCCEYCEEIQVYRLGAKQPAAEASAFGKAVR